MFQAHLIPRSQHLQPLPWINQFSETDKLAQTRLKKQPRMDSRLNLHRAPRFTIPTALLQSSRPSAKAARPPPKSLNRLSLTSIPSPSRSLICPPFSFPSPQLRTIRRSRPVFPFIPETRAGHVSTPLPDLPPTLRFKTEMSQVQPQSAQPCKERFENAAGSVHANDDLGLGALPRERLPWRARLNSRVPC